MVKGCKNMYDNESNNHDRELEMSNGKCPRSSAPSRHRYGSTSMPTSIYALLDAQNACCSYQYVKSILGLAPIALSRGKGGHHTLPSYDNHVRVLLLKHALMQCVLRRINRTSLSIYPALILIAVQAVTFWPTTTINM
jgi:hypothetical protein